MKNTSIIYHHFVKSSFWLFLLILTLFLLNSCQDSKTKPDKKETPIVQDKLTDEEYEKEYGLSELLDKELIKIEDIHGQSYITETDCCEPEGKVSFTFNKAYNGKFPDVDRKVKGMYVKLNIQADENCCKNIKIMQIKRSFRIKRKPKVPRKWKIDAPGNSPYATDYEFATEGKNGQPAIVFDKPGQVLKRKNIHVEYMTIILCVEPGKKDKPLAYVHWGFDIHDTLEVKPFKPKAQCGAPDGMEAAVATWNKAAKVKKGRLEANIDFP